MSNPSRQKPLDNTRNTPDTTNDSYPQIPDELPLEQPGLTGGPATDAVPHAGQSLPPDVVQERERTLVSPLPGEEDDGGEATLSSRPRETGGERPPKPR